jgi:8-oxo-dGTP diphosphatase
VTGAPDRRLPNVGVGIVILRNDNVLLIQRGKPPNRGHWSLPGGHQEMGETVFETARREALEETGLDVVVLGLVDVVDAITHDRTGTVEKHYTLVDIAAESHTGEACAGDDAQSVYWAPLAQLGRFNLWCEIIRVIRKADGMRRR